MTDGRITAIGDEAEATATSGPHDAPPIETIDLPGAMVIPGLHDAHIHTEWVARNLAAVDLREAESLKEAQALIREHLAGLDADTPLTSGRWNSNRWTPATQPNRHDLDTVAPDRIAILDTVDGHSAWVNSLTLQRAGITRDTPDPVGGEIARDENGEPTGILRESAMELLDAIEYDEPDLRPLMEDAQEVLLSLGLTAITDIDGETAHQAFRQMHADGALKLRVTKAIRDPHLELAIAEGRRSGQGDDVYRIGPVKFFSDGALGSHTAHMTEPYLGDQAGHENCGIAVTPYPVLVERIRKCVENGLDVCTHAIGDEANRLVLDAYEQIRSEGHAEPILRIEHAQHVRTIDVPRYRTLGVVASMQPTHCTTDLDLADAIIGQRRLASYAWQTFLNADVALAFGSDAPVEEPNPFHGLHAAVTRQRADGIPPGGWHPEERLSMEQAMHAHTVGAHAAAGVGDIGSLVPGQLADFVAIDRDLFDADAGASDPSHIRDTVVLQTWIGADLAFARD